MTREEIVRLCEHVSLGSDDAFSKVADAVRALPVIATCGNCGWCDRDDEGPVCGMAEAVGERIADLHGSPPSWCPLRGGR